MSKLVKKLKRPPYVHNLVRYIKDDVDSTTKALVSFAKGYPLYTYVAGNSIIFDRLLLNLDRNTAMKAVLNKGHKNSRMHNSEYIKAFYDFDEDRGLSRMPAFDQMVAPYRINREISVPVKPLAVLTESGRLNAIFSVGWQTMPLSNMQWRLLMTMMEDAVFTLTDFHDAHGEFCSFPRSIKTDKNSRKPQIVKRGDFDLLSKAVMQEKLDIYLQALEKARLILSEIVEETDINKPQPPKEGDQRIFPFLRP